MTYGIKVSKPGFDVKTTESKNLTMTSELVSHKVLTAGTAVTSVIDEPHGLTYAPATDIYFYDGTNVWKGGRTDSTSLPEGVTEVQIVVTSTMFSISVPVAYPKVFYVIFHEGNN